MKSSRKELFEFDDWKETYQYRKIRWKIKTFINKAVMQLIKNFNSRKEKSKYLNLVFKTLHLDE